MKKQIIKINESQLAKIVETAAKKYLKEGNSYGWEVDSSEADKAYEYFCNQIGTEAANEAIVRALGSNPMSDVLAYLFRMYDLRGWEAYRANGYSEDEIMDDNDMEMNEEFDGNTKSTRLGLNGPTYGITPNGEWYAYDPTTYHSFYCNSEEEAKAKAEELKIKIEKGEAESRRKFDLMNSLDEENVEGNPQSNENDYRKFLPKDLEMMYNSQDGLTPLEQNVLNGAMWVRAMWANYHGYSKNWPEMFVKDGEIYFYDKNGKLGKVPYKK